MLSRAAAPSAVINDRARVEVAERGHTNLVVEQIVHRSLGHAPPAIALRVRLLLRQFFSSAAWTEREAGNIAGIVGNGAEWHTLELDPDLRVSFGWRGGRFRVEASGDFPIEPAASTPTSGVFVDTAGPAGHGPTIELAQAPVPEPVPVPRSLAASFDSAVSAECRAGNRVVMFKTGAGTGSAAAHWIRPTDPMHDERIGALFCDFPQITGVQPGAGGFDVEIDETASWVELLLPLIARFCTDFAPPRLPTVEDRDNLRAEEEFAALDLRTVAAQLRVRHGLKDKNPHVRRLALEIMGRTDPLRAPQLWKTALDDPAREVRRVAAVGLSEARAEDLRPALERALTDSDAFTRFHAARGLWYIGAHHSRTALSRALFDADARVRVAAQCTIHGQRPPD